MCAHGGAVATGGRSWRPTTPGCSGYWRQILEAYKDGRRAPGALLPQLAGGRLRLPPDPPPNRRRPLQGLLLHWGFSVPESFGKEARHQFPGLAPKGAALGASSSFLASLGTSRWVLFRLFPHFSVFSRQFRRPHSLLLTGQVKR